MLNVSNSLYILFGYLDALVTFPLSKYTFLQGFDCLEACFELKIQRRNQPCEMVGPSRARCTEKCGNLTVQGFISEHFEAQWGLLGRALTSLGTVLASTWGPQAMFFHEFVEKV